MTRTLISSAAAFAAVTSLLLASPAVASTPTTTQMPGDYSQTFSGADSPCGFDITLSGTGTVTVTTYYDNAARGSLNASRNCPRSRTW